jgi:hypothetical protein
MAVKRGIYTLANDRLYDQVVALVNSIRSNYDQHLPICIIPYDDNINRLQSLESEEVYLFNNQASITKWSDFALAVWNENRFSSKKRSAWYHGANTIRKLCSFDGPFDHFIYIDSDALVMSSLEDCFNKLKDYDCVFDDWEHKKNNCFLEIDLIKDKYSYNSDQIRLHCHASDFFAAKSTLINSSTLNELKSSLLSEAEVNFINERGWWDEVYLFSYITFKLNFKVFNYTLSQNPQDKTGNIAGVDPFVERNLVLYNAQGLKPIHRIHYMGYSSEAFTRLCLGEEIDIPHREVFLHYRFMREPEKAPKSLRKVGLYIKILRSLKKGFSKLKKKVNP